MKPLPILYKKTQTGAIQQWQIIVSDFGFYTIEGQIDGKLTQSSTTVVEQKNIGKLNETTQAEQSRKEATAKWQKKIDMNGYHEGIDNVNKKMHYFEPMLAHKWEDRKDKIQFPVYSQSKLDGMRCIVNKDGMWSRKGKQIVSAPHIYEALKSLFDFNPDYIFDGELYADKYKDDFNKIMSLAKKSKPTLEDLKESSELLEYHIYDFPFWDGVFIDRYNQLKSVLSHISNNKIKIVNTVLCKDIDKLDELFSQYIKQGYEGQMVRINDCVYENKRTNQLLKRKDFMDEEFKIIDIIEGSGNRSGMAGSIEFKNKNGQIFNAGIAGGFDFYKDLWLNKKKYIGVDATVKYFQLTPDGIPRFGVVTSIRDYE